MAAFDLTEGTMDTLVITHIGWSTEAIASTKDVTEPTAIHNRMGTNCVGLITASIYLFNGV